MFSVIIPTYNSEKYLAGSIESVLAQSNDNFEIIVVNDGSTDNTSLIIEQYANHILAVTQANHGLSAARNTGIQRSKGEFIALLDSDDIWHPNYLATMHELITKYPDGSIFFCGAHCIDNLGNVLPQSTKVFNGIVDNINTMLLYSNFIIPSTTIIRRELFDEVGLFDINLLHGFEDWDFWLRIPKKSYFIGINKYLVYYRLHPHSMSRNKKMMHQAAQDVILKHYGPDDKHPGTWENKKRIAYAGLYRYMALTSVLSDGDWSSCERFIQNILVIYPPIAKDLDFFYELSLGNQPVGYRNQFNMQILNETPGRIFKIINNLPLNLFDKKIIRSMRATAHFALGIITYSSNQVIKSRYHLINALKCEPKLIINSRYLQTFIRCLIPRKIANFIRKL